jgi:hypothetical protein
MCIYIPETISNAFLAVGIAFAVMIPMKLVSHALFPRRNAKPHD